MLRRPNEAALARGDAVIRANVSAEDRWHAKTSLSTSPPLCVCVCVCPDRRERGGKMCQKRETRKTEETSNVWVEEEDEAEQNGKCIEEDEDVCFLLRA